MFKNFGLINNIENTLKINSVISSIGPLTICKKNLIANYSLKKKIVFLLFILEAFRQIIYVILGAAIGIVLPLLLIQNYANDIPVEGAFIKLFIMLYFVLAGFTNCIFFEENYHRYFCIKRFHVNAKQYFIQEFFMTHLWVFVGEIIVILLYGHWIRKMFLLLPIIVCKELFSCFGETVLIAVYKHGGLKLCKSVPMQYMNKLIILAFTAAWIILLKDFNLRFYHLIAVAAGAGILGIAGMVYLFHYVNYLEICMDVDKAEEFEIDYNELSRKQELAQLQMNKNSDADIADNPFGYLNSLFFKRHKKIVYKNMRSNMILSFILLGALVGFSIYKPVIAVDDKLVQHNLSNLFFMLYLCTNVKKVIRAMFFDCDFSMLRYNFYRSKKALVSIFVARFFQLSHSNLINFIPFLVTAVICCVVFELSLITIIYLLILIVGSAYFFSVVELDFYYFLQPYKADSATRRPLYVLIQYLFPFLLLSLTQYHGNILMLIIFFVAFIIILTVISAILVYKYACNTFRIWP